MKILNKKHGVLLCLVPVILITACSGRSNREIESKYENGKPKIVKYYTGEGQTKAIVKEIQYYPGGEIKVKGDYENGKKSGQWIFYYENGEIWSQGFFKNGLRTGKTMVYHENGQLFYEGEYFDGQKQGNWNFYNEEGRLVNSVTFDAGKLGSQPNKVVQTKDTNVIE